MATADYLPTCIVVGKNGFIISLGISDHVEAASCKHDREQIDV